MLLDVDSEKMNDLLGVSKPSRNEMLRSTIDIKLAVKELDEKVVESDVLSRTMEK